MRAANSPATEARGIRLRGELGISRQTIAQGRPDVSAVTCMLVCVFLALIAHETAGASQHPAFPAPSDLWGQEFKHNSGATRRGKASPYLSVVPANAGTHNHREQYFARWLLHRVSTIMAAAYGSPRQVRNCAQGGDDVLKERGSHNSLAFENANDDTRRVFSSRISVRVIGGSARWLQFSRSQSRQLTPIGVPSAFSRSIPAA